MVTAPWAGSASAALIALCVFSSAAVMVLLFVWLCTVIRNHGGWGGWIKLCSMCLGLLCTHTVFVLPCKLVRFSLLYPWSLSWILSYHLNHLKLQFSQIICFISCACKVFHLPISSLIPSVNSSVHFRGLCFAWLGFFLFLKFTIFSLFSFN